MCVCVCVFLAIRRNDDSFWCLWDCVWASFCGFLVVVDVFVVAIVVIPALVLHHAALHSVCSFLLFHVLLQMNERSNERPIK